MAIATYGTLPVKGPIDPNQLLSSTVPLQELPCCESTSAKGSSNCDDRHDNDSQILSESTNTIQPPNDPFKEIEFMEIHAEGKAYRIDIHPSLVAVKESHRLRLDHIRKNDGSKILRKRKSETDRIDEGHEARLGFARSSKKVRAGSSQEDAIIINDKHTEELEPILTRATVCLEAMLSNVKRNDDLLLELEDMGILADEEENLETLDLIDRMKWRNNILHRETNSFLGLAKRLGEIVHI